MDVYWLGVEVETTLYQVLELSSTACVYRTEPEVSRLPIKTSRGSRAKRTISLRAHVMNLL